MFREGHSESRNLENRSGDAPLNLRQDALLLSAEDRLRQGVQVQFDI
jgi:hypothetical protein